jgi:hypothetical protein
MYIYSAPNEKLQGEYCDLTQLHPYLSLLRLPVELRIPVTKVRTISGYFDDLDALVSTCKYLSGNTYRNAKIETIYTTLNPFNPDLVARSCNRLTDYAKNTTSDKDILKRLWLPLDIDSVRPAGICATDDEKKLASETSLAIRDYLVEQGFPSPVVGDSGNGGHLLYRVDLANTEDVTSILVRFYESLTKQFSTEQVKIDTAVYNAARIWKVYGTKVCKGDEVGGRVHRLARIMEWPKELEPVPMELIEKIVAKGTAPVSVALSNGKSPEPSTNGHVSETYQHNLRLAQRILADNGIGTMKDKEYKGGRLWVLEECPFCGNSDHSAHVEIQVNGKLCFACKHNSCRGKYGWQEFREKFDPEAFVPGLEKKPVARTLLDLADCDLWHTPDGEAFATVNGVENHPVASKAFAHWLTARYLDATGKGPSQKSLSEAVATLAAKAVVKGPTCKTFYRIAQTGDGIFLDLGDDTWRCVRVTKAGWSVVSSAPVKFVRNGNTAALPEPRPGNIDRLRRLVHVTEPEFHLLVGSILDALKGHGPYFVTILNGEYGSAKSTMARLFRALIDPVQTAPLAAMPKDERDLGCEGHNNHIMAFDNISKLPRWLSDSFCRVATGAGIKTRKLYTDSEQQIFDVCRPLLLNGIEDFATAGDLVDRAVQITLQRIDPDKRMDEKKLALEIREAAPEILGALLDGLVHGLRTIDTIKLDHLPRMADSTKWIAACLPGMGLSFDTWLRAYQESQNHGIETSLESSLTAKALLSWWQTGPGDPWVGTPKELYETLIEHVPMSERRYFPANPKSLSDHLRRDAPALRQKGIVVQTGLHKWLDGVSKRVVEVASVPSPPPEYHPEDAAENRLLDAESLTQDAALTQEFCAASRHNMLENKDVASSLTHLTQDSSILTPKDVRRDMVVEGDEGRDVGDSCVKVRQGDLNDNTDKDLRLDAAQNACVKAASRPSPCVKFWSGNKVMMKAYPEVKGKVMGYLPFEKVYHLLLADAQVPQAIRERLYSPAGMPGQARIQVAAEEIVLCEW